MELNREQIVKALECCVTQGVACRDCPHKYDARGARCYAYLKQDALALIRELTEENERLRAEAGNQSVLWRQHFESIYETAKGTVKADTVRKMQIKFAMHFGTYTGKDTIKVSDLFKLLSKFADEMLEGE